MRIHLMFVVSFGLVSVGGCKGDQRAQTTNIIKAAPLTRAECGACSMVVAEQPAPRGQLVHRDGTRKFFCSLSCMAHYMAAPSPHGETKAVFVEQFDPKADPAKTDSKICPWVPAKSASYVLGIKRSGVMGEPALSFLRATDAKDFAKRHKGRVVDFAGMSTALRKKK